MTPFRQILANNLIQNVTNFTVWFALVFWAFLETRSVFPLTQFVAIPFMTTGAGTESIGDWYGTGPERGMALVFSVTGVLGVVMTLLAFGSRQYRPLSATYAAPTSRSAPQSAQ